MNLATLRQFFNQPTPIEPLVTFRILFGGLMATGAVRFMQKGWVERLYEEPKFFFKFYNFEWIQPLSAEGMYILYSTIALSAALVMLGLFYRIAIVIFFLSFTYTELIDVTNYLNHYYLVCLLALLLCFLPAHRAFSLDVWRNKSWKCSHIPAFCIYLLLFQVGLVYFFCGLGKNQCRLVVPRHAFSHLATYQSRLSHTWKPVRTTFNCSSI
ncbi:MAG: HTTM domain-containing protein [Saprospiraceae bacterium]|nr:HTTM domain-containing protein [Saprospiraceae bacterium]